MGNAREEGQGGWHPAELSSRSPAGQCSLLACTSPASPPTSARLTPSRCPPGGPLAPWPPSEPLNAQLLCPPGIRQDPANRPQACCPAQSKPWGPTASLLLEVHTQGSCRPLCSEGVKGPTHPVSTAGLMKRARQQLGASQGSVVYARAFKHPAEFMRSSPTPPHGYIV